MHQWGIFRARLGNGKTRMFYSSTGQSNVYNFPHTLFPTTGSYDGKNLQKVYVYGRWLTDLMNVFVKDIDKTFPDLGVMKSIIQIMGDTKNVIFFTLKNNLNVSAYPNSVLHEYSPWRVYYQNEFDNAITQLHEDDLIQYNRLVEEDGTIQYFGGMYQVKFIPSEVKSWFLESLHFFGKFEHWQDLQLSVALKGSKSYWNYLPKKLCKFILKHDHTNQGFLIRESKIIPISRVNLGKLDGTDPQCAVEYDPSISYEDYTN
jgi:hypothetical protein